MLTAECGNRVRFLSHSSWSSSLNGRCIQIQVQIQVQIQISDGSDQVGSPPEGLLGDPPGYLRPTRSM